MQHLLALRSRLEVGSFLARSIDWPGEASQVLGIKQRTSQLLFISLAEISNFTAFVTSI